MIAKLQVIVVFALARNVVVMVLREPPALLDLKNQEGLLGELE